MIDHTRYSAQKPKIFFNLVYYVLYNIKVNIPKSFLTESIQFRALRQACRNVLTLLLFLLFTLQFYLQLRPQVMTLELNQVECNDNTRLYHQKYAEHLSTFSARLLTVFLHISLSEPALGGSFVRTAVLALKSTYNQSFE